MLCHILGQRLSGRWFNRWITLKGDTLRLGRYQKRLQGICGRCYAREDLVGESSKIPSEAIEVRCFLVQQVSGWYTNTYAL